MGLTNSSTGRGGAPSGLIIKKNSLDDRVIAFAGNPNVGKSSLFNRLTGMHQHTGNWPGKTVQNAVGTYKKGNVTYHIVDLPGCYSLNAKSEEERVAGNFIEGPDADIAVVVCDATCIERNLILVFQILSLGKPCVICLNLIDEAKRLGISIDTCALEKYLGAPVIATSASTGEGIDKLTQTVEQCCSGNFTFSSPLIVSPDNYIKQAETIYTECVKKGKRCQSFCKADKIIMGRYTAFPVMALFLALVFWLTLTGANYPSRLLQMFFSYVGDLIRQGLEFIGTPPFATGLICDGAYSVTATVVSVMLPPMAIFFPLFTLLEDAGFLPRIAFNLDRCFRSCATCGKQSLTMCMGFGCNAAGITGCRIIDSPRERMIAILTNSFVPCNGRFPAMIAVITAFFSGGGFTSSLILTGFVLLGIGMTLLVSKLLSLTLLRGKPEPFTLELPPYRKPRIGQVIVRSIVDRTLFVLGRAAAVAAPAGCIIWILANTTIESTTLLSAFTDFLEPAGRLLGLDGVILSSFILGFPANELVIPVALTAYTAASGSLSGGGAAEICSVFTQNGWNTVTAVCMLVFIMFHWPCSTSLWTIKKETGKLRYAVLGALLPTTAGTVFCFLINTVCSFFGAK